MPWGGCFVWVPYCRNGFPYRVCALRFITAAGRRGDLPAFKSDAILRAFEIKHGLGYAQRMLYLDGILWLCHLAVQRFMTGKESLYYPIENSRNGDTVHKVYAA